MPKKVIHTVIFVHTKADVKQAINYRRHHPDLSIAIYPTDIAAIATFSQIEFTTMYRIDQVVRRNQSLENLVSLPLDISRTIFRHVSPPAKIWIEIFRSRLVKVLSHYYILSRIYTHHRPKKIIFSPYSFSAIAMRQFCSDHNIALELLPKELPSVGEIANIFLASMAKILILLFRHPLVLIRMFQPHIPNRRYHKKHPRIVVFSNGLNLASYAPVFTSLSTDYQANVTIICDKQGLIDRFYLAKYQINAQPLKLNLSNTQKIYLQKRLLKLTPHLPRRFNINSPQIPPKTLRCLVESTLAEVYLHPSRLLTKYLAAGTIINKFRPQLVITTHDPGPSGLSFVLQAKTHNIPTMVLLHGSPSHIHFFYSDYQIIWGKLMQKLLVQKAKIPKNKLIVAGHPIYAYYRHFLNTHKTHPTDSWRIGILTTGEGKHEWYQGFYFLDLLQQLNKLPHPFILQVRTHGMQHLSALEKLAQTYGINLRLNPPQTLEEFVGSCDVIITQNTTAALVPLLANKPTLLLDPWFPFLDEGLLKYSPMFAKPSLGQTPTLINKLLLGKRKPKPTKKFIQDYCGSLDDSGHDIAQKIMSKLVH